MGDRTFAERRREIKADPVRRARVERHKAEMELALHLVELRERTGTTQTELADRLGVSQSRISRLERAQDLQLSTLQDYVEALGGKLEIKASFPEDAEAVDLVDA